MTIYFFVCSVTSAMIWNCHIYIYEASVFQNARYIHIHQQLHPPSQPLSLCLVGLLKARPAEFLSTFALKCSSWSAVNAGTSGRSACSSLGVDHESVKEANCMGVRNLDIVCIDIS